MSITHIVVAGDDAASYSSLPPINDDQRRLYGCLRAAIGGGFTIIGSGYTAWPGVAACFRIVHYMPDFNDNRRRVPLRPFQSKIENRAHGCISTSLR